MNCPTRKLVILLATVCWSSSPTSECAEPSQLVRIAPATPVDLPSESVPRGVESIAPWSSSEKDIDTISVTMPSYSTGDFPKDLSRVVYDGTFPGDALRTDWASKTVDWEAPRVMHQPLYFDDTTLERYGQTRHPYLEPVASTARFFGTFVVMPVKLAIEPPFTPTTDAGLFRPGSPTPCMHQKAWR